MALSTRARPSFTHSQSLPPGSFHSLLSSPIRGETEWKPLSQKTNHTVLMDQTCLTQWNYETYPVGPPKSDGSCWRVLTKRGPLEKGIANFTLPLQHSYLENPMNSIKRQKDMTLKVELPRSVGTQYATGEEQINISERMKRLSQRRNNTQLWMRLMTEARLDAVKSNIA